VSADALPTPQPSASTLASRLLPWFEQSARDLPWRQDRTGYRVWVSEVMLQQTRVSTVIPFYKRFLERFPSVTALAEAPVGDVLALWSGLGYYRRARALHDGAKDVVARFGGELPETAAELKTIKGIGPYTAGAIASLAFGEQTPLVDGNVIRVFSRLFAIDGDPRSASMVKKIWAIAAAEVPAVDPGAFNESLMELGATVCTPRSPSCLVCPARDICEARRLGDVEKFPASVAKRAVPIVHAASVVERDGDRIRLARRRGDALFGGMWEPPMVEAADADVALSNLRALATIDHAVGEISHVLTHRHMKIQVTLGSLPEAALPEIYDHILWVHETELASYGISTLTRKVLAAAKKRVS
jgi:A/G-specific adenine glycosylase